MEGTVRKIYCSNHVYIWEEEKKNDRLLCVDNPKTHNLDLSYFEICGEIVAFVSKSLFHINKSFISFINIKNGEIVSEQ